MRCAQILNAGSAIPQGFDQALLPQQVLALAGGFLTGCVASDLGLTCKPPPIYLSSTSLCMQVLILLARPPTSQCSTLDPKQEDSFDFFRRR